MLGNRVGPDGRFISESVLPPPRRLTAEQKREKRKEASYRRVRIIMSVLIGLSIAGKLFRGAQAVWGPPQGNQLDSEGNQLDRPPRVVCVSEHTTVYQIMKDGTVRVVERRKSLPGEPSTILLGADYVERAVRPSGVPQAEVGEVDIANAVDPQAGGRKSE